MMTKRLAALAVVLLLAQPTLGQAVSTWDDFSDEPNETDPVGNFYTYSDSCVAPNICRVEGGGFRALRSGGGSFFIDFAITSTYQTVTTTTFYLSSNVTGGGATLFFNNPVSFGIRPNSLATGWALSHTTAACGAVGTTTSFDVSNAYPHKTKIRMDWNFVTGKLDLYADDVLTLSQKNIGFCTGLDVDNVGAQFNSDPGEIRMDGWIWGGDVAIPLPTDPVPETPPDFGSGILNFASGLGFITPESQFFFALLLIGITTVTGGVTLKFMAPGRWKVLTIATLGMILGIFCVVLGMFALWMYVLAIVLAGTIIKGSGELRNTWAELRQTMAQRGQVLNAETGEPVAEPAAVAPAPVEPTEAT